MDIINIIERNKGIIEQVYPFVVTNPETLETISKQANLKLLELAKVNHPNSAFDPWDEELEELITNTNSYATNNGYELDLHLSRIN